MKEHVTVVTRKGQITVPIEIRRALVSSKATESPWCWMRTTRHAWPVRIRTWNGLQEWSRAGTHL